MKDVLEPFSDIGAPATACWCTCFNFEDSSRSCDEHKAALVAEVRRLRAEVVTLECERAPQELVDHLAAERDAAHAEAERLRGELDAAEGAMADIAGERAEAVAEAGRVREALQVTDARIDAAIEWGRSIAQETNVLPLFRALGAMPDNAALDGAE